MLSLRNVDLDQVVDFIGTASWARTTDPQIHNLAARGEIYSCFQWIRFSSPCKRSKASPCKFKDLSSPLQTE